MSFAPPRPLGISWQPEEGRGQGLEYVTILPDADEIVIRGVIIGEADGRRYGVDYTIVCDQGWTTRALDLGTTEGMALSLRSDGAGHWLNYDGRALPEFDGCLDVDLEGTPLTNTLPIRRHDWVAQPSATFPMLYVPFDRFVPLRSEQRYTALAEDGALAAPRRFRYEASRGEAVDHDFVAELPVDRDGLVLDYPGLFRRVRA